MNLKKMLSSFLLNDDLKEHLEQHRHNKCENLINLQDLDLAQIPENEMMGFWKFVGRHKDHMRLFYDKEGRIIITDALYNVVKVQAIIDDL